MARFNYLKSTIFNKAVMAVTGIVLLLYIIGHTLGNLQIFLGRDSINTYAYFLHSTGELLWIVRGVLLLSLIFHVITSIWLKLHNVQAKPQKYAVKNYLKAKFSSRTMIWTGIMIFAFVVYHLLHFTIGATNPEHFKSVEYYEREAFVAPAGAGVEELDAAGAEGARATHVIQPRKDVYKMMILGFREPAISIAYMIAVIILGFHLAHATQSAFQTLGVSEPTFTKKMIRVSSALGFIIATLLTIIPLSVLLRLVGGDV
ncbi:MAG: succinate dehydrogenase cytochrome b subunit [Chloroflexota bacterium]